ncbi:orexin/Hypocretin receptor type 1-like [Haliotis rubra]|uniref:orexin/Hypocretin receptor type 1-like n=1 Tax=Haliotis rubra TaxID=36100 RepID=UPI001EE59E3D|nr:orexin/Hypocretin receptor type 1-like [Haliotis rubra]
MMSANTTTSHHEAILVQRDDSYAIQVLPAILILAVLMLLGVVGNSLVCYVYLIKLKRNVVTYFISSLAFLDLLNCVISIPYEIAVMRYNYTFGTSTACMVVPVMIYFISITSAFVLVAVAVDRFRKICKALKLQVTTFMAKVAVFGCCAGGAVVSVPITILYGPSTITTHDFINGSRCSVADEYKGTTFQIVYHGIEFLIFLMCTASLIALYAFIWRQLARQRRFKNDMSSPRKRNASVTTRDIESTTSETSSTCETWAGVLPMPNEQLIDQKTGASVSSCPPADESAKDDEDTKQCRKGTSPHRMSTSIYRRNTMTSPQSKRARKTTMMLFMITLVFVLSFLPHLAIMAAAANNEHLYSSLQGAQIAAYNLFERSYLFNSAFNPIIYSFFSDKFRRELKVIFGRR